jgi:hypothetical protein
MTHFNMNSGLFYLRANARTIDLMQRLEARLARETYWDQSAYNEEMFVLSHGARRSPQVTVRVMDIHVFMNSKTLFKFVRHLPSDQQPPTPAMVHISEYIWGGVLGCVGVGRLRFCIFCCFFTTHLSHQTNNPT